MGSLDGRHVVVTGGNGALGRAVVAALVREGATVSMPDNAQDVSDADVVERFYDGASSGGLWASIHVAGGFSMAPLTETTPEDWRGMLDSNATTAFLCTRAAARRMVGGGRVVNVAAVAGLDPAQGAHKVAYTVSKAAVVALTIASAAELASAGVLVNAVAPGTMDTPANRAAMPDADRSGWLPLDLVAARIVAMVSPAWAETGRVFRLPE